MVADVRAALNYLSGEPQVATDKMGIWGTSFGGALALMVATGDTRVKALVDQMGPVNFEHNYKDIHNEIAQKIEFQTARGGLPLFPSPKQAKNPGLRGYPDWAALKRFNTLIV
jgi:hypothetical protein